MEGLEVKMERVRKTLAISLYLLPSNSQLLSPNSQV